MLLEVKDLVLKYGGIDAPSLIVDNLSAACPLGILGWGGSGKTSFLRVLCGVEIIEKGEIFLDGVEIGGIKPKERNIALISKDTPLFSNKTALYNLEFPLKKRKEKLNADELPQDIRAVLNKNVKELEEKTRIDLLLLRAVLRKPSLTLIDEPAGFCSDAEYFVKRAGELFDKNRLVLATYDCDLASLICENFALLRSGKIVFCGNAQELRNYARSGETLNPSFVSATV